MPKRNLKFVYNVFVFPYDGIKGGNDMTDAYHKIKKGRPKWDKTIYIWGAVSIAIVAAILIPICLAWSHMYRFHGFLQNLAVSCDMEDGEYAVCYVDGKNSPITHEKLGKLMELLTDGGCGKKENRLPKSDACRIDFPNGSVLELWRGEVKDPDTKEIIPSLYVCYTDAGGDRYSYLTHVISVKDLRGILPSAADDWIRRNLPEQ